MLDVKMKISKNYDMNMQIPQTPLRQVQKRAEEPSGEYR